MIRRPPKVPEITNRLAAPVEIEQYHQMCARTQIILKATVLIFNEFRTHATEDRKLQLNADALDSFLRVFLHANGRAGETLAEGNILGPIRINPNVPDLGVEIPIGIPLYIGKIRTDRLAEASV